MATSVTGQRLPGGRSPGTFAACPHTSPDGSTGSSCCAMVRGGLYGRAGDLAAPMQPGTSALRECAGMVRWAISRRRRNKEMHAANGNGPPKRVSQAGRGQPGGGWRLEARQLQEVQLASTLRSTGWTLPEEVPNDSPVRVYDTRLQKSWLRDLLTELGPGGPKYYIGGDFLTKPRLDDGAALDPTRFRRWGPEGDEPYELVIPPRPHIAEWVSRCRKQLDIEAPDTLITLCMVVKRDLCGTALDFDALRRIVPQAEPLLLDKRVAVQAVAVGERPPLVRVPAVNEDEMVLPPRRWEEAQLPRNRVLLLLRFRLCAGERPAPRGRWCRGELPPVEPSELELMHLEYQLPPATKQENAVRLMRAAVRRLAEKMKLDLPVQPQLRNIQAMQGLVTAIMGVPPAQALEWMRGSGFSGLLVRPFFTERTSKDLGKDRYKLLRARGSAAHAAQLWETIHDLPGVFGVLVDRGDLAVRYNAEAHIPTLQAQLRFIDDKAVFREAIPGQRWWRLGPMKEAEVWQLKSLIADTGLSLRNEPRTGPAGPFRSFAFFLATGVPTKLSFDDGTWGASDAKLQPAAPPPRTRRGIGYKPIFTESAAKHTWSHHLFGQQASASPPKPVLRQPSPPPTPEVVRPPRSGKAPVAADRDPPRVSSSPALSPPPDEARSAGRHRRGGGRRGDLLDGQRDGALAAQLGQLLEEMAALRKQNDAMLREMAALRQENDVLRRQLAAGSRPAPDASPPRSGHVRPRADVESEVLPGEQPGTPRDALPPGTATEHVMETDSPAKTNPPVPKRAHGEQPPPAYGV